jgi:hypothetical protein
VKTSNLTIQSLLEMVLPTRCMQRGYNYCDPVSWKSACEWDYLHIVHPVVCHKRIWLKLAVAWTNEFIINQYFTDRIFISCYCLMMVPWGSKHVTGNKYPICKILIDYNIVCCRDC